MPRAEASQKIEAQIDKGLQFLNAQIDSQAVLTQAKAAERQWSEYNKELLTRLFDSDAIAREYDWAVPVSASALSLHPLPLSQQAEQLRGIISARIQKLNSILERLELIPEGSATPTSAPVASVSPVSTRVFVVHGHDDAQKEAVARFLEKLELKPIILHEQPNAGRTLIEKFEAYSDVGFAVVLLTADDVAHAKAAPADKRDRARQNVIFELGFFVGKLGRQRVCALYKRGVEIPSDFEGVVFVPLDDPEGWRLKLAREIKEAGLEVDLNKAV